MSRSRFHHTETGPVRGPLHVPEATHRSSQPLSRDEGAETLDIEMNRKLNLHSLLSRFCADNPERREEWSSNNCVRFRRWRHLMRLLGSSGVSLKRRGTSGRWSDSMPWVARWSHSKVLDSEVVVLVACDYGRIHSFWYVVIVNVAVALAGTSRWLMSRLRC